jgi:hypothetical protein
MHHSPSSLSSFICAEMAADLPVHPSHYGSSTFPHFSRPLELGCLSRGTELIWESDSARELRVYKEARLGADLRDGFDIFIEKDESVKERLDAILAWIRRQRYGYVRCAFSSAHTRKSTQFSNQLTGSSWRRYGLPTRKRRKRRRRQ